MYLGKGSLYFPREKSGLLQNGGETNWGLFWSTESRLFQSKFVCPKSSHWSSERVDDRPLRGVQRSLEVLEVVEWPGSAWWCRRECPGETPSYPWPPPPAHCCSSSRLASPRWAPDWDRQPTFLNADNTTQSIHSKATPDQPYLHWALFSLNNFCWWEKECGGEEWSGSPAPPRKLLPAGIPWELQLRNQVLT